MKKIKEYRMSLMEKDFLKESKIKGKTNYIIRYSAFLEIDNYLKNNNLTEKEREEFTIDSSKIIFEELIRTQNNGKYNVDSVGLWVRYNDQTEIDNSIELSVLDEIKKYGDKDIDPIKEFFKMTIQNI